MTELSQLARKKRHYRVRRRIVGTLDVPRLSVFRSLRHMYVQIIDDINGETLLACSTLSKQFKDKKNNKQSATELGEIVAEMALGKGIKRVVFDRGGYRYHGRIQALADSARKAGLVF